jgi:hypothetical protein
MKSKMFFVIPLLLLVLSACGSAAAPQSAPAPAQVGSAPASDGAVARESAPGGGQAGEAAPQPNDQQGADRLVIKTADMQITVGNMANAESALRAKVAELGGYVVSTETSGFDNNMTIRVTFRVPVAQFDAALGSLQGLAERVLQRTISGQDVTEEFVDLESRLRNLEATRDRLLDFLNKAEKVEDALEVNKALTEVQGEIEQIKGRMQFLKQSAALSTITATLTPVPLTPIVQQDGWTPLETARVALSNLVDFGQELADVVIGFAIWIPVWLPLLLVIRWAWKKFRVRRTPAPTTVAERT